MSEIRLRLPPIDRGENHWAKDRIVLAIKATRADPNGAAAWHAYSPAPRHG
jgi:hypothetical protein